MSKVWRGVHARSRSLRARGLKPDPEKPGESLAGSRSLRARGLKLTLKVKLSYELESRSLRARGLKLKRCQLCRVRDTVALFTGAWIETSSN